MQTTDHPLPPGSLGLPLIGETISFLLEPTAFFQKRQAKFGPIFKTHLLGHPTAVMIGAEANRLILSDQMERFSWRSGWPSSMLALAEGSLLVQDGAVHDRNRKAMMPAFHGSSLAGYISTIEQVSQRYVEKWQRLGAFKWYDEFRQLTFEIASMLLIGTEPGAQTLYFSKLYETLVKGAFTIPVSWRWTPFGRALQARTLLLEQLESAVRRRMAEPAHDVLGMLVAHMQDEEGLSLDEIKVQAMVMVLAAHDTTSSFLSSICMALAQNPEVLAKARAEQAALGTGEAPTLDQLGQLKYLEQVMHEVERRYPPFTLGFRRVLEPFSFAGYTVPAGWKVCYRALETHLDGEVYSDPERFDPERFSPERAEHKQRPFSLVAFGGGPRVCLGMSLARLTIKIVLSKLLHEYRWELMAGQDMRMSPLPNLHPRGGLKVRFERL